MPARLDMAESQRRWLLSAAWCAVVLGVLFRVLASAHMDLWADGVEYVGLIFSVIGFGVAQAKVAIVAVSLAALGAVYATTRDLFGADRAVVVAGLVALEPGLVWVTGIGLSENFSLFGDSATSPYMSAAYEWGLTQPALVAKALLGKGTFFGGLLLIYAAPFWPELRASLRRLREAETSVLWLFVLVIWSLAWWVTSAFWPYEQKSFFSLDHQRYILIGVVPLLWLVVREGEPVGTLLRRWGILAAILLIASSTVLLNPVRRSSARAAEFIDPYLRDGDTVIIKGSIHKYDLDAHFSRIDRITVRTMPGARQPDFAFLGDLPPEPMPRGYELVGSFEQGGRSPSVTYVIAPVSIIRERELPTNVTEMYD